MENKNEEDNEKPVIDLELQLGDVIHITNPINDKLNDQTFIVDYIDKSKVYLINTDSFNKIKLIPDYHTQFSSILVFCH